MSILDSTCTIRRIRRKQEFAQRSHRSFLVEVKDHSRSMGSNSENLVDIVSLEGKLGQVSHSIGVFTLNIQ